jgi:8-oxo-dGTP pyrophosphatase MutT (NUDIX family)
MAEHDILVDQGTWSSGTEWKLCLANKVPEPQLVTSAGCVAVRDLASGETILTYSIREENGVKQPGRWEILGGHLDPLDKNNPDGPKEPPESAVRHESVEEGGCHVGDLRFFAYRWMYNPPDARTPDTRQYPEIGYAVFYVGRVVGELFDPTDPSNPAAGSFRWASMERMVQDGAMQKDELTIIQYGWQAGQRWYA